MKKKYISPDFEFLKIKMSDLLAPSTYEPDPQDPGRDGEDNPGEGDL